jgi:hypothetical protein
VPPSMQSIAVSLIESNHAVMELMICDIAIWDVIMDWSEFTDEYCLEEGMLMTLRFG